MKKTMLAALFLLLVAGMVGAVSATNGVIIPEGAAEYPLYAGQDTQVGNVSVWNNVDYLYVYFELDDGWCMTESHLAVNKTLPEIPQTKKFNPIPGQFPYGEEYSTCVSYDLFEIPLADFGGDDCGSNLYIAAHARVWTDDEEATEEVCFSSAAGAATVYGPLDHYAAVDSTDWGITGTPAVATYVHPNWPSISGATWISNTYLIEGNIAGSTWRKFSGTFDVPGYPLESTATVTSDNAEEFYVNGIPSGSDGEMQGTFIDNHEWGTVLDYTFTPVYGMNTYDFIVRNYDGENSATNNPTGLIFEICYEYSTASETAWAGTDPFEGKNWATYFTYDPYCCPTGELVANGGFEYPHVETSAKWDVFTSDEVDWMVEWFDGSTSYGGQTRPEEGLLELHISGVISGVSAFVESQYAELDTDWVGPTGSLNGEPASVSISQDLDTCPGETYTLAFAWKARDSGSKMNVTWDGTQIDGTYSGISSAWNEESESVTATGYTTRLNFTEVGNPDSLGMFLDGVSVELV